MSLLQENYRQQCICVTINCISVIRIVLVSEWENESDSRWNCRCRETSYKKVSDKTEEVNTMWRRRRNRARKPTQREHLKDSQQIVWGDSKQTRDREDRTRKWTISQRRWLGRRSKEVNDLSTSADACRLNSTFSQTTQLSHPTETKFWWISIKLIHINAESSFHYV